MNYLFKIIFLFLFFITTALADELSDKLDKIDKQLDSVGKLYDDGVLSEEDYNKTKKKLLDQAEAARKAAEEKKKSETAKKPEKAEKGSGEEISDEFVARQLEVIKKLFDDGVLSVEEYNKTKKFLLDKAKTAIKKEPKISDKEILTDVKIKIGKSNKITWEKAEMFYGDYRIYTYRQGGIKIKRISDDKTLVAIMDNFKVKYSNGGEGIFDIKITKKERPTIEEETKERVGKFKELMKDPTLLFKKKKYIPFDKNEHKLELRKDGRKLLHYEGRYVAKHRAFFYQVLTGNFTAFHFYVKIMGKPAIAFNMEMFNKKIDKAVRKAKKKISAEFNVTEEQIDEIINKKIEEEADKAIDKGVEEAVQKSVEEAIAQSVGEAMSEGLVNAIEEATGEAIDEALEAELAAAIDAEIAYAVSQGIEEAAVTAGWQAYFDTLAAGGTDAQASAAAYEACGSACDNY